MDIFVELTANESDRRVLVNLNQVAAFRPHGEAALCYVVFQNSSLNFVARETYEEVRQLVLQLSVCAITK